MKHILFLLLLFSICSQKLKADYMPLSLPDMIMMSELIVVGTIQFTDSAFFTLEIEQKVYGNYSEKSVRVKKFVDFSCAARWMPYAAGQKVLLFLDRNDAQEWVILSDGGEGELPVDNDNVYLSSWYGFDMPFKAVYRTDAEGNTHTYYYQAYELYGKTYYGVEFSLNEFGAAVGEMRLLCSAVFDTNGLQCTCKKYAFDTYKTKSSLQRWLGEYGQQHWNMVQD